MSGYSNSYHACITTNRAVHRTAYGYSHILNSCQPYKSGATSTATVPAVSTLSVSKDFADCSLLLVSRLILPAVRHGADMSSIVHPLTNCPAHKPLFVGLSASRLQYLDIRFTSSKCLQKT
jgi:hypothetical protein